MRKIIRKLVPLQYFPRYARLDGELTSYELSLPVLIRNSENKDSEWYDEVKSLLAQTRVFLSEYKIDEAWKSFHTAQQIQIFGMNEQERLDQAKSLKHEISKLNVWRRHAIDDLIGDPDSEGYKAPPATSLSQAIKLKDEYYNNQYYKNTLTRTLYKMLFWLLFFDVGLIIWYISAYFKDSPDTLPNLQYLFGVILFGLLGAITSSILFTRNQSAQSRITEINSNRFIVLSKIAVGVGFTIFIFYLLRSSIADNVSIFSFEISTPRDYFTIAFLSGFTERVAQKAIDLLLGGDKEKKE